MNVDRAQLGHSLRVAAITAALIAVGFVALAAVFDIVDNSRLIAQEDAHLSDRLADAAHAGTRGAVSIRGDDDRDVESAPIVLWQVWPDGRVVALTAAAPPLPAAAWSKSGSPVSGRIGDVAFRTKARYSSGTWLVAGQSLGEIHHVESVVLIAELVAAPLLIIAMFLGALVIGLKASAPVEEARRRQLEFTADASHELRTPLSVIQAEVSLALSAKREAPHYKEALKRVGAESDRLKQIVEDLLWLARFDSKPPHPVYQPVDIWSVARDSAGRFSVVAASRRIRLEVMKDGGDSALVKAPHEWVERLAGVLLDNACRYAGDDGEVLLTVSNNSTRVFMVVEDSGPGIAPEETAHLFDRFHRADQQGGGAGLGLAIADAVVKSTEGRWRVGRASAGGARMEVSWPRWHSRDAPPDEARGKKGHEDEQPLIEEGANAAS